MKISPFYYILTIEEEKSFSKAAKKLGISQPALSAYVSKLEAKLGEALFDRTALPLKLTEVGRLYYEYVKNAQLLEQSFEQQLADQNNLATGNLVIGGANSFTIGYLPDTTSEFLNKYPGINIRIIDARVPELVEMALDSELDFFITGQGIDDTGLELEPLLQERIFICLPKQWEINESLKKYRVPEEDIFDGSSLTKTYENLPISYLEGCPFILLEEDLRVRNIANRLFELNNFVPRQAILIGQIMTSLALTVAGNGICFISDYNIRQGNLKQIPAIYAFDKNIAVRELAVAYKKNRYMSHACREYIHMLQSHFSRKTD